MKLAAKALKAPAIPPPDQPATNQGSGVDSYNLFFGLMVRALGVTRKELAYELRWSDTYIDGLMNGTKNDPIQQTRRFCEIARKRNRMDLVATIIVHVAGGDDFDGRVLTAVQVEALRELAKVVK